MQLARVAVAGWVVAAVVVATATGCGNGHNNVSSSSTATTSSAGSSVTAPTSGQAPDYGALLIKPNDIGGDFNAPQPPVQNPNNATGVAQLFTSADRSRRIGDTILVFGDPAEALAGIDSTKANYAGKVSGTWEPVDVGSNGTLISGTSADNSQAITVLLFAEGRALVNLEFDSAANDPVDPGVATDIGHKQDIAIKTALTG